MKSRGSQELNSNSFTQDNIKEEMVWIPIDDLDKHTVYPTFLKEYLSNNNTGILHIVTDENQLDLSEINRVEECSKKLPPLENRAEVRGNYLSSQP